MDRKTLAVSIPLTAVLLYTTNNKPTFQNNAISLVYKYLVPQSSVCAIKC